MLELRPNCEFCDTDLPADAPDAMICSYECTFCLNCVNTELCNVCPNCGGGFEKRPVRPRTAFRPGTGLANTPASTQRVHLKHDPADVPDFIKEIKSLSPGER